MSLVFSGLSPHPPLLVPEIGGESLARVEDTRLALQALCRAFVEREPETVVFITPHGPFRSDAVSVLVSDGFEVSFQQFDWHAHLEGDRDLAERICEEASRTGFPTHRYATFDSRQFTFSRGLDHATMVPLFYLWEAGCRSRVVVISVASWPHGDHFEFGKAVRRAVEGCERRVAVMCSGDLSHRLIPEAPSGYEPRGIEFDRGMVRSLEQMDVPSVLGLDEAFVECIGECGLRPISMLLGILEGCKVTSRVLSYEGPFGVGYCVAMLDPAARGCEGESVEEVEPEAEPDSEVELMLDLARAAVESHVRDGRTLASPAPLPPTLHRTAGAFVCLKRGGQLRGCIGTIRPTQDDLASEVIQNAISAATRDPRFPPVAVDELSTLRYSVDVLEAPEPVASLSDLDPQEYGVIVRSGSRSGVLLPHLEGVDTVEHQLHIARQKAGIPDQDPHQEISRFRVRRYERKMD